MIYVRVIIVIKCDILLLFKLHYLKTIIHSFIIIYVLQLCISQWLHLNTEIWGHTSLYKLPATDFYYSVILVDKGIFFFFFLSKKAFERPSLSNIYTILFSRKNTISKTKYIFFSIVRSRAGDTFYVGIETVMVCLLADSSERD